MPDEKVAGVLAWSREIDWAFAADGTAEKPFVSVVANYIWLHHDRLDELASASGEQTTIAMARFRPKAFREWLNDRSENPARTPASGWLAVMRETVEFDEPIIAAVEAMIDVSGDIPPHRDLTNRAEAAFRLLAKMNDVRDQALDDKVLKWAKKPLFSDSSEGVEILVRRCPEEACEFVRSGWGSRGGVESRPLFQLAVRDLDGAGGLLLVKEIGASYLSSGAEIALELMVMETPDGAEEQVRKMIADGAEGRPNASSRWGGGKPGYWAEVAKHPSALMQPEMRELLCGTSKALRVIAAGWFVAVLPDEVPAMIDELVSSKKIADRIGGVHLLRALGTAESARRLQELHAKEPTKAVRVEIGELVTELGVAVAAEPERVVEEVDSLGEFEKGLAKKAKSIKMPKAAWLDVDSLPTLVSSSGDEVSELVVTYLFQLQARQKGAGLAEELVPLLPFLDRSKNAGFAKKLLDQWFASDMKANARWGLDVAGIVGDDSIINRLVKPIPEWCAANHGKRAEWAVHAIALLGTDRAMQTLDGLIQKYRSHRKYVGAAATEAIRTLAAIQGVKEEEMADRIVPSFDLDDSGEREFQTKSGDVVVARLKPELKLVWRVGEGKEAGTLPKNLRSKDEAAAKDLRKYLKEAVKSQARRLERAMIEGRRWGPKIWQERFEGHPIFRGFSGALVWGAYDADGKLLRTFRRYANGILADVKGEPEGLGSEVASVGLVHPLELDAACLKEWATHLSRMKVKPMFPQIGRAVERLDPLHGNRREQRVAEGVKLEASAFRARVLGCGWAIGSTQDGGYIYDCFRKFPGAGLEVYLSMEGFHATSGRGDEVTLGTALFARYDPTAKRSYLGLMPSAESESVMSFAEVPAVVYSETVADLKAIIGEVKG
ncbi:DUF4132 domain-containing protein [Haloferula sp.]|uniref:DUF4132 domain-containing protein n=1 Tax=Haloferula sp. TaxID=2497595 RepID=UPI003C767D2D